MGDLVMCLLSDAVCLLFSFGAKFCLLFNSEAGCKCRDGGRKRVRKCFPLLTQALSSVSSLCGIRVAVQPQSVASGLA